MKLDIKITGDRDFLKAIQSRDPNAFLKYVLKKTYNIEIKDGAAPSGGLYSVFDEFMKKQNRRHRKRKSVYDSVVGNKKVWVPDETAIRLIKDPQVKKEAWFGSACKTLLVRIKNIPLRFLPKKKKKSPKKKPVNHYGAAHSVYWILNHGKKVKNPWEI